MSEATLNLSPSAALAALFSHMGRTMLWVTVKAARAPLTTIVCGLAAFGIISATSNALYMQPLNHPSPFFTDKALVTSALPPVVQPIVVPTPTQPQRVAQPIATPVAPAPAMPRAVAKIGHADIKLMQEKLRTAGLYVGDADGFYGPRTAGAIRGYEARHGLPEVGALTPDILNRIVTQPQAQTQATAPANPIGSAPARRVVAVEKVVQQITNNVADSGEKLVAAAEQAQQQIRRQIEATQPDRLTQIVQRVAGNSLSIAQTAPAAGPGDKAYVKKVQRGLASLGFLHGEIDGVAGEGTARAVRNFEVYYNYKVTGAITPELVDLLAGAGAEI